jgi:hypothetical protein
MAMNGPSDRIRSTMPAVFGPFSLEPDAARQAPGSIAEPVASREVSLDQHLRSYRHTDTRGPDRASMVHGACAHTAPKPDAVPSPPALDPNRDTSAVAERRWGSSHVGIEGDRQRGVPARVRSRTSTRLEGGAHPYLPVQLETHEVATLPDSNSGLSKVSRDNAKACRTENRHGADIEIELGRLNSSQSGSLVERPVRRAGR